MVPKSPTITNPDWLHNAHAGEILASEFMEPLDLTSAELAAALSVHEQRLQYVLNGRKAIDAELDLRLGRYFQMSEGFFLRLQDDFELLKAKRALSGELERIAPRAA
ncbi:MAG: HigA family addiction module antidote protein [Sphingomonadales bacterium]|nr:HigA family addiction module antidote protein [Sphingomonadales bacterium]